MKLHCVPILLLVFALCGASAGADDAVNAPVDKKVDDSAVEPASASSGGSGGGDLAKDATNPVAPLIQLQLQNLFIPDSINADGYANQIIVQPVIPIPKFAMLPRSILRPTIPVVSSPDIDNGPNGTTGLGDVAWVHVWAFDQDWGVFGVGEAGALQRGRRHHRAGPMGIQSQLHAPFPGVIMSLSGP